ncbi:MAG: hypothetical protein AAFY12_15030, partial [Pseudomonadota bacterium]
DVKAPQFLPAYYLGFANWSCGPNKETPIALEHRNRFVLRDKVEAHGPSLSRFEFFQAQLKPSSLSMELAIDLGITHIQIALPNDFRVSTGSFTIQSNFRD